MKCRLGDVVINFDRQRIPLSAKERKQRPGTFRYFGAQGVIDYIDNYIFDGQYMLVAEDGENVKSQKQNIAQIVYGQFWVNNHAHVLQSNGLSDLRYLCYVLNIIDVSGYVTGSAQPKLSQANLNAIELDLPPLSTQQAIADTLSTLDSRIALNKKINHHLEQMAQVIFKSWFVDFEPFGGEQPDGWQTGSLTDIAEYLNGLAMQRFRPVEDEVGLPVLKIKELRQGSCDSQSELCSPNIRSDYIVHDGEVIFSWSGSLLVDFWCGGDCGLNQHLFKVTSRKYDKWFYYAWTCHHLTKFAAMAADKATTMGHIKREALEKAKVIIPDEDSYLQCGSLLNPLYEQVINNRVENRKLSQLRDTLLPRLISGELSVTDLNDTK